MPFYALTNELYAVVDSVTFMIEAMFRVCIFMQIYVFHGPGHCA